MAEWHEKQMRIIHPSVGFVRDELPKLDVATFARDVVQANYNVQHLEYSIAWDGENKLFLFQTDQARQVMRDLLGDYLPAAHAQGIKVFIYMNVHWANKSFITEHPNWVQRKADGSPLTGLYGGGGTSPCVNAPYRDWIVALTEEMASKYEIDGIFLDGPCFYLGTCYCDACRAKFAARYGLEISEIQDERHPHWREFIEFRYDSITEFVRDCRTALRKYRPSAPLYMNANGLHSGRVNGRHDRKLIKVQDILGAEGGFIFYGRPIDVPLWKVSGTAKFLEAQAEGKPTVIFTALGHKPWEYPLTEAEILLNTASTFAAGANPWIGTNYGRIHDPSMKAATEELGFFARHEDLLSGTVGVGETALFWSHDTADYYGSHLPEIDFLVEKPQALHELDYQSSFQGGYEALMRSGTPFVIVDEFGVNDEDALAGIKTLLLPDVACMSDETAQHIRQFVSEGGTLVATNNTSLMDETGRPRADFALSDVLGASYVEPRGLSQWDLIYLSPQTRQRHGFAREEIPSPTYQLRVKALLGAEVAARYYEPTESRYSPKPDLSPDPALIYNRYGKGECLYWAGNAARFYWTYRISEHQTLLAYGAMRDPLVAVGAASQSVEVILRRSKQTGDWFIHLLNYTGGMERPIKRIVPLSDVTLRLRCGGGDPSLVRALRLGRDLAWERQGDTLMVTLPTLTHHEVIHVAW